MTASVSSSVTVLPTTPESVLLNACCAPMTSLLSRETRAPVRVRVKNATGIRCTWSKTAVRRSTMRPSPIRADWYRVSSPRPASASAITAIPAARRTTGPVSVPDTIASTTRPASTGAATVNRAATTLPTRNQPSSRRCGRANPAIRFSVAREKGRWSR
ncbi:hypothetical protein CLV70_102220 [Pseudosporangium ferrugineum]|uniref:Uncharacterized protein n=1 Tax=Pseudosporangium ferrugineum TaxID=439699 RepID=A0A2T0SF21_9ACTN|nr:hypothetical protein CLV70_102220 [Pseudosporangium ferrugineum]